MKRVYQIKLFWDDGREPVEIVTALEVDAAVAVVRSLLVCADAHIATVAVSPANRLEGAS